MRDFGQFVAERVHAGCCFSKVGIELWLEGVHRLLEVLNNRGMFVQSEGDELNSLVDWDLRISHLSSSSFMQGSPVVMIFE